MATTAIEPTDGVRDVQRGPQKVHHVGRGIQMQQEEEKNNASIYNFNNSKKPDININIFNANNNFGTFHISATRDQKHTRQKRHILQIHVDTLGVKHTDGVRILFENFNGLTA